MSVIGRKLRSVEGSRVAFRCPGCDEMHVIKVGPAHDPGNCWGYNGDPDAPTFTPSILVRTGHYATGGQPGNCYCDYAERHPEREPMPDGWICKQCHSFVTNGRILFLGDCSHHLAGQTVDLPDLRTDEDLE
jgi:hypothetical protein